MKHDSANQVACPQGTTFLQYTGDKTDRNISAIDGKNTHHGLGSISVANGNFGEISFQKKAPPRGKNEHWSSIASNEGIPIKSNHHPDTPALSKVILQPVMVNCAMIQPNFIDRLWNTSYVFKAFPPSWSSHMSKVSSNEVLPKSTVAMLPIIKLHATAMNALYSLLWFISYQCRKLNVVNPPAVTFDQPLYVKACEIVLSMNMNIIRFEGFHQLMSFLSSIGCVMEGAGLQNVPETAYAPINVGHMLTGKTYSRAIRGYFLTSSALMSMLLKEIWENVSSEERSHFEMFYDSDPSSEEVGDFAARLCSWNEQKKLELTSSSRTAAPWLNYIQYTHIVQAFIRTKRTSNWSLHIGATKSILNLFAVTGHNNYAKTCHIYIQFMEEMQQQHALIFKQFILGSHTVKCFDNKWARIWTDLSIVKILMKSPKSTGGVISRGMSENILRVCLKTMHKFAEVSRAMDKLCFPAYHIDQHKE